MTQMRVTNAFLANYAEVKGGVVYASGCFPEWFAGPSLPTIAQFFLVVQGELEPDEVGQVVQVHISLRRPDGRVDQVGIGAANRPFNPEMDTEESPRYLIFIAPTVAQFGVEGLHHYLLDFEAPGGANIDQIAIPLSVRRVDQPGPDFQPSFR